MPLGNKFEEAWRLGNGECLCRFANMALASSGRPSSIGLPSVTALVVDSKCCSEGKLDSHGAWE